MADPKIDAMRRVPLFNRCNQRQLQALAQNMDEVDVVPGQIIITQGRATQSFCIILTGGVDVAIDNQHVATLGAGDFFGEIGMIDREPATATVTVNAPGTLLALSHEQFRNAITVDHELSLALMEAMASRLREDEELGFKRADWSSLKPAGS
jgi:CRP-like cAMP-binding protein